jgi:hypothetical protein
MSDEPCTSSSTDDAEFDDELLPTYILQEIALYFVNDPEHLHTLPQRLSVLMKMSAINREWQSTIFEVAMPELIRKHVPAGEQKAHAERTPPTFENLAEMGDGMLFRNRSEWIPFGSVVSQKTRDRIAAREPTYEVTRRWVNVQEIRDLYEDPVKRWNLVPLHREIHARKYMTIGRADAMSKYMLTKTDLRKLSPNGLLRLQFNVDSVCDLAAEIHGSMAAIEKKKADASAIAERKRLAKVARIELRTHRVQSLKEESITKLQEEGYVLDPDDWSILLDRHGDVKDAVHAFEISTKASGSAALDALKTFALDLAISRMRDVLQRRRNVAPWPSRRPNYHYFLREIQASYDTVVWYDSEDPEDLDVVRNASERWGVLLERFAQANVQTHLDVLTHTNSRIGKECYKYMLDGDEDNMENAVRAAT